MTRSAAFWLWLLVSCSALAQDLPPGPLPEPASYAIRYKSVAEALASLKSRKDVSISTVNDWVVVVDTKNMTVWSFAPTSYPAYPSVVKRAARQRPDGGSEVVMSVLCEATKEACDQLVREFDTMNKRL